MNRYITTYQKDYTWPDVLGIRSQSPIAKDVPCNCLESGRMLKKLLDLTAESCDWNRPSSAKVFLKPKLCSSKIELISERAPVRLDQSSTCLKKLVIRCPDLYEVLEKSLPCERTPDPMKTTYQVDYSDPAAARMIKPDKALIKVEMHDPQLQHCIPINITIEADCRPPCPFPLSICKAKKLKTVCKRKRRRCEDVEEGQTRLPPWKSEYQSSISKIGQNIMTDRLHHRKKETVTVWAKSN